MAERDNVIQLVLHRMQCAELLDEPREPVPDFDLEAYIREGGFSYADRDEQIQLKVRFTREAAVQLCETPLAPDQKIEETDPDHMVVTATVRNDWQLTWWLRSFGDGVEVLEPASLRDQFRETAARIAAQYTGS